MKNDKFQNKYNQIFREMKEEKMDWNFDDFLKKTEEEKTTIIPINHKNGSAFPKLFWLAASMVLLVSLGFLFKNHNKNNIQQNADLVKSEIERQKKSGELIDTLSINQKTIAINDSIKKNIKKDTLEMESPTTEVISVEKILPKRGRIKRNSRTYLVENTIPAKKPEYESSYVIINGQKIENEKEAIDVAKYSLQMLSDKVAQTVTADNTFNTDY